MFCNESTTIVNMCIPFDSLYENKTEKEITHQRFEIDGLFAK